MILHSASLLLPAPAILAFLFLPLLRIPLALYFTYIFFISTAGQSGDLGNRSTFLRSLPIWKVFASYFPAALHRTAPLDPSQNYIFGYHPHGIICHGAFIAFCTEALGFATLFPGITNTLLLIDANFRYPIYREYALRIGLRGVSQTSCLNLLTAGGPGRAITIAVGGARESLLSRPDTMRIVLRNRQGFIKLAVKTGAHLVPVLAFGENDLYGQLEIARDPRVLRLQDRMRKGLGWTLPLFYGGAVFGGEGKGVLALRRPLNVVVGRPVVVVKQEVPEVGYVEELHQRYLEGLNRLWEEHKEVFARGRAGEIEFV